MIHKYNRAWPDTASNASIELACYLEKASIQTGGLGEAAHLKNACMLLYPEPYLVWSEWADLLVNAWCDNDFATIWGAAACGKTHMFGAIAMVDWLADPSNTRTVVCSTTVPMLEDRIWGSIEHFYGLYGDANLPAKITSSKHKILYDSGGGKAARAGIYGVAVLQGSVNEAKSNIIGVHLPRMRLIVDEMQATRRAAVEARGNMTKGASRGFKFFGLGNPMSRLDPLGEFSQPVDGWNSININTGTWLTKYGRTYHFDGFKSPAIRDPKKYHFLITQEQIDKQIAEDGENSPDVMTMCRGFMPMESSSAVIIGEAAIVQHRAMESVVWRDKFFTVAGFDPAFSSGGDKAVLSFLNIGFDNRNALVISIDEIIRIKLDMLDKKVLLEQMCKSVISYCQDRDVSISHLGVDDSGTQSAADEVTRISEIEPIRSSFGKVASEMPISEYNNDPCSSMYADKVTEMWYSFAKFIRYEQIRSLIQRDAIYQFSVREVDPNSGRKKKILSKKKMKDYHGVSPDDADSIVIAVDVARQIFGIIPGSDIFNPSGKSRAGQNKEFFKKSQDFYNDDYSGESELNGYDDMPEMLI